MISKICSICSKEFLVRKERKTTAKFCSIPCKIKDLSIHPRRKRERTTLDCAYCSKQFEVINCRVAKSRRHFCSANCRNVVCGREKQLNKYPKVIGACQQCKGDIVAQYMAMDKPWRKFCSKSCKITWRNKNVPQTEYQRKLAGDRMRILSKIPFTEERRIRASLALTGEKSKFWRGGLTDANRTARNSIYSKLWREKVFKRDNWTCQWCGARSGQGKAVILNADHIKAWALYPELRFEVNNGRTLCLDCHKKTDNFGFKASLMRQRISL